MKCSRCQHENPQDARYCEACAAPVARLCWKCATVLSATAKFCHACAHEADRRVDAPPAADGAVAGGRAAETRSRPSAEQKPEAAASGGFLATLTRLAPLIQGVLIAAVGTIATITYNERQVQLAQLAALDKYRAYITSANPQERLFGYQAFVSLGEEKFVIRLIAATQDAAGERVLTALASNSTNESVRKEAKENLDALLAEAARQRSLGRTDTARKGFDEAIQLAPDNERARLERDTLDDWRHLVKAGSKISPAPYLKLAQHAAQNADLGEARSLLSRAATLFDSVRVLEIAVTYDAAEIDMETIRDSLTLWAADGTWMRPPETLLRYSFQDGSRLVIWSHLSDVELRFNRHGFEATTLRLSAGDWKGPEAVKRSVSIRRAAAARTNNVVRGKIRLHEEPRAGGVSVSIFDGHHENRGFQKTIQSDRAGRFTLDGVPDGRFQIAFEKPGYVPYVLSMAVKGGKLTCFVDESRRYAEPGIEPCALDALDLRLYRVRQVTLDWMLQENATARHFRTSTSSGRVQLSSALGEDWYGGGWQCCKASFKLGTKRIDDEGHVDIVVFTETDGQIHFGQPYGASSIAEVATDFASLLEIPAGVAFAQATPVRAGKTYLLRTSRGTDDAPQFFAKIRVVEVK